LETEYPELCLEVSVTQGRREFTLAWYILKYLPSGPSGFAGKLYLAVELTLVVQDMVWFGLTAYNYYSIFFIKPGEQKYKNDAGRYMICCCYLETCFKSFRYANP